MSRRFDAVANVKLADAVIQVLVFAFLLVTVVLKLRLVFYGVLAMAGIQVLSCLLWSLYFTAGVPRLKAGTYIRRAFFITLGILALSLLLFKSYFLLCLYLMIFAGPIQGFAYFLITLKEISFFRKARKPYYLL